MQAKFLLIAQRLNMTKTDLVKFTPPKAIYSYYQRRLIYDMNKSQIDIFENILIFPASAKTVKQRKESLIMFLENHPNYRDITYIHIWFNIAEDYLKIGKRIRVPNYTLQKLPINEIVEQILALIPNTAYMEKSVNICTTTFDTIFKMSKNPFYTYVDYVEKHLDQSWIIPKSMDFDVMLYNYKDLSCACFALCSFICLKNIGDFSFNNDDPLQGDDSVGGFISLLLQTVTNWIYSNASSKVEKGNVASASASQMSFFGIT